MTYTAGFAKVDITVWEPAMVMLGWAQPHNQIHGIAKPLHARALVLRRGESALAYVCAELCFITIALRRAVLLKLETEHAARGLGAHNVMLTATHTHSGPSGFSQYFMYNGPSFGFSPVVFSSLVDGIVRAIVEADDAREPAMLRVGTASIPLAEPVAFNRSPAAYNENGDTSAVDPSRPEQATERLTTALRVDDAQGRALGVMSWFGVHCSNISADNTLIHSDNKGLAADFFERAARREPGFRAGFVAIFAQEAAGDVSPRRRTGREPSGGDLEAAALNGEIQYRYARRAWSAAKRSRQLSGPLGAVASHVDMTDVEVDRDLAFGLRGKRTSEPVVGLSVPGGTTDGPGPLRRLVPLMKAIARARWMVGRLFGRIPDVKLPFLEVGRGVEGRFLGAIPMTAGFELVAPLEPMIAFARAAHRAGDLGSEPLAPRVVPLQLACIGELAVAAIPGEPTTVAGRRVRSWLAARLAERGIKRVIVNGYANGYAGYVATFEEYQHQEYEAASTYYGPWTLAAYGTMLSRLASSPLPRLATEPVEGPALDPFDPLFLARQRRSGRKGLAALPRPGRPLEIAAASERPQL